MIKHWVLLLALSGTINGFSQAPDFNPGWWTSVLSAKNDSGFLYRDTLFFFTISPLLIPDSVHPPSTYDFFLLPSIYFFKDSIRISYNCFLENPDGKILHNSDDAVAGTLKECDEISGTWKQVGKNSAGDIIIECEIPAWKAEFKWKVIKRDKYGLFVRL